ncbi:hypothetical protein AB0I55_08225 [Actinocatenispora sera]|uniref:hypothetical protein n=1 Tax=Actinocatenispora sera TaxID=390989 RepID=UPI0033EB9E4C
MGLIADPFSYQVTKSGEVRISRGGRVVVTLRGAQADRVVARLGAGDEADQQLLARVTGNYRRGTERRR